MTESIFLSFSLSSSLVPSVKGKYDHLFQAGPPGQTWNQAGAMVCGEGVLCHVARYTHDPETLTLLTLGADGLGDGAGLTEAPGSHGSHQEQVDGIGLQATDGVCLQLHAVCHRPPHVARGLTTTRMR